MAKAAAINKWTVTVALSAIWCGNYLSAKLAGFPFLYCWLNEPAASIYLAAATGSLYAAFAYVAFQLYRADMIGAAKGAAFCFIVIELPRLASYVFKLGATCG